MCIINVFVHQLISIVLSFKIPAFKKKIHREDLFLRYEVTLPPNSYKLSQALL